MTQGQLLLLQPQDNVLVVTKPVWAGQDILIDGRLITARFDVAVGHKLARHALTAGMQVIKYGAPIGSMTQAVDVGDHVHLHNMKSDYIATHGRTLSGDAR